MYDEVQAWQDAGDHAWVFDKLLLARRLGYMCGPVGVDVMFPGLYIVRPCVNILGMGMGAHICYIRKSTDHLPYGYFWCETFAGDHLSIDIDENGEIEKVVRGHHGNTTIEWESWERLDKKVYNEILDSESIKECIANRIGLKNRKINVECIGERIIEIHLRWNPDFQWGNKWAVPDWGNKSKEEVEYMNNNSHRYIECHDSFVHRKGLWIG